MQTVFSHIIQKRYSQSYEDIATDSLAYILNTHESARNGFMTLLRSFIPDLPYLHFRTQMAEGSIRPDMWGYDGSETYIYVENKFWAGLTKKQPVAYLNELAEYPHQSLLLMVVPGAREQTMIAELLRKLKESDLEFTRTTNIMNGIIWCVKMRIGPWLALTSWPRLIEILETSSENDPVSENDLALLSSLCDAADIDKFIPFNANDLNNQLTPSLILQLVQIIQDVVEKGVREHLMDQEGLTGTYIFEKYGKYIHLGDSNKVGIWFGLDYKLWKTYGISPLWMRFSTTEFGRAYEVGPLLETWVQDKHFLSKENDGSIVIALNIEAGSDKDQVIAGIIDQFRELSHLFSSLNDCHEKVKNNG